MIDGRSEETLEDQNIQGIEKTYNIVGNSKEIELKNMKYSSKNKKNTNTN
jgi:hypothetical protein